MIYLDHHAATPLAMRARAAMDAARDVAWANPSSAHGAGRASRALLERARERIAAALGASPADCVLTSGGSEAVTLGVLGLVPSPAGAHVVTTRVEHPAVAAAVDRLAARGATITRLELPQGAPPSERELDLALRPETALVALQWVNHETGTILPIEAYAASTRRHGARFFVDATQALGKLPISLHDGVDALAVASHKCGGPAGAGALWVRRSISIEPLLAGGAQERGRRPGTPDVVSVVGFGAACEELPARLDAQARIGALRDTLEAGLVARLALRNASAGPRVATVTNTAFEARRGDLLVAALDLEGVCVASGAACSSGLGAPSAVLTAMHPDAPWRAERSLRWSLGPESTPKDIEEALTALDRVLAR